MNEIKKFLSYIKGYRTIYWTTLFSAVLFNAGLNILSAYVNKEVFNAMEGKSMEKLIYIKPYAILLVLLACLYPITRYLHITVVRYLMKDLKLKLFHHLEHLDIKYFEKHHSGDSIQRLSNDVDALKTAYFTQVFVLMRSTFGGITSIITMFLYDYKISLIVLLISLASVRISIGFTTIIRKTSNKINNEMSILTQKLSDILSGFQVIKMYGGANRVVNLYKKQNETVTVFRINRNKQRATLQGLNIGFATISTVGVMMVGAFMVSKGITDYGTIMAVITLQSSASYMFTGLGKSLSDLQTSMSYAARVYEVLETPTETELKNQSMENHKKEMILEKQNADAFIYFHNVAFGYENKPLLFNKLIFHIPQNSKAAFLGESGGGKSSILKLLLGLYEIEQGEIQISGKNLQDYSIKELRNIISYVPQDAYLFEETIRNNIRYGRLDATYEKIEEASKTAFAHEFIIKLPHGYDTVLNAGGNNLSGGEKQRIAIARAILKNAPIVLLDEATSALDNESEVKVQQGLERLMKNKTVLTVAHRLSTVEKCDIFYHINNGILS
jgi:ABC-type multidrug transport system fused ATPase/permease subunit